ncbi:MAG: electron transfer flavoprotein subunit alpha/FixB family protein [Bacteroidota bacterium]
MSVLVFIESEEGAIRKSSLEAVSCAFALAQATGTELTAVSAGDADENTLAGLGAYGASKVLKVSDSRLATLSGKPVISILQQAVQQEGSKLVVFAISSLTDAVAPGLAARLKAGLATNVVAVPEISGSTLTAKRSIYTGKAFSFTEVSGDVKVITMKKNAVEASASAGKTASVQALAVNFSDTDFVLKHISTEKATGDVLLPEAEIVVSGGRGLKGPENWGMIEDLAKTLGAATACSKPVSDLNWRPHHEHVGQTGIKVSPNLYIAIGISGAIQHVAGISSSKVIVAINSDPEAPIFKAADYGIVGNAFEIVPKLTAAFKAAK